MNKKLAAYLLLEEVISLLDEDENEEELADDLYDKLYILWFHLSDEDRKELTDRKDINTIGDDLGKVSGVDAVFLGSLSTQNFENGIMKTRIIHVIVKEHGDIERKALTKIEDEYSKAGLNIDIHVQAYQGKVLPGDMMNFDNLMFLRNFEDISYEKIKDKLPGNLDNLKNHKSILYGLSSEKIKKILELSEKAGL